MFWTKPNKSKHNKKQRRVSISLQSRHGKLKPPSRCSPSLPDAIEGDIFRMALDVGHSSEYCQQLGHSVSSANSYMALGQGCKFKVLSVEVTQARWWMEDSVDCLALAEQSVENGKWEEPK